MSYTWHRRGRTYSFSGSPQIESEENLTSPSYAYDTDESYFFRTEDYSVPLGSGTWILWTEETESIDKDGVSLGVISSTQLKISKNGNIETWQQSKNGGPFVTTKVRDLTQVTETISLGWEFFHISKAQSTGAPPPGSYRCYWEAETNYGQVHGRELVGTFEIRSLRGVVLEPECPVDPVEEPVKLKAEIYALPAPNTSFVSSSGWEPDGDVEYVFQIIGIQIPSSGPATFTPQTPDSSGKIGSVEVEWDGRNSEGIVQTLFHILGLGVLGNDTSLAGNIPGDTTGYAHMHHRDCNCESSGELNLSFLIPLMGGPIGVISFIYNSFDKCKPPASLGYGWNSQGSSKLVEQANGDLVYRNEGGFTLRWTEDNGIYTPFTSDNYVKAESLGNPGPPFRLTFRNQSQLTFDSNGRLTARTDRNGNTITYTYANGLLDEVSDSKGRTLYYDYGTRVDGQPVGIRAHSRTTGRLVQLEYTGSLLRRITDPENHVTEFEYDQNSRLSKVTQVRPMRTDITTQYTYDAYGQLLEENHQGVMLKRHNRWPHFEALFEGEANPAWTPLDQGVPDYDNERLYYQLRDFEGRVIHSGTNYTRPIF